MRNTAPSEFAPEPGTPSDSQLRSKAWLAAEDLLDAFEELDLSPPDGGTPEILMYMREVGIEITVPVDLLCSALCRSIKLRAFEGKQWARRYLLNNTL